MKTYIVNAAQGLTLPAGAMLRLTEEQARVRQVAAIAGKRGHYRLVMPTTFKRGEQIGLAEAPSKALAHELVDAAAAEVAEAERLASAAREFDVRVAAEVERLLPDAVEAEITKRVKAGEIVVQKPAAHNAT